MRKIFFVLFLLMSAVALAQCVKYKKNEKMNLFTKKLVFPVMTSAYEELTNAQLQQVLKKRDLAATAAKSLLRTESDTKMSLDYKEYNKKNDYIEHYVFDNKANTVGFSIYQKIEPDGRADLNNSMYFIIDKSFYSDGTLKSKKLIFDNNSLNSIVLKHFEYDKNGKLIKEFDTSKIFKLSLVDVLKILEKNNLPIDFNKASLSAGGTSYVSYILYKATNHGNIWIIGNGSENFQAIIYDENGEILVERNEFSKKIFLSMEKWLFDDTYKGKTIEEVERETGLTIFVYE